MKRLTALAILLLSLHVQAQNIAIGNVTLTEGNTGTLNLDFPITVNPVSASVITLSYSTTAGSATAGTDFVSVSGTSVSIPAGSANAIARVAINGDVTVETLETLTATISNASSGTIVTNQGLGQITDNDSATLSIASVSQAEGNTGSSPMAFIATLSNPVQGNVRITVASSDGSATAGSDYVALPATVVSFAPLSTTQAVPVTINGDTQVEADESFTLALSALELPVGISTITAINAAITGTVLNDDRAALTISDVSGPEGSNGATTRFSFNVGLQGSSALPLSVNFSTRNGTAIATQDYTATSGSLTFAPGESVKTILVTINADNNVENPETFEVVLSDPSPNLD